MLKSLRRIFQIQKWNIHILSNIRSARRAEAEIMEISLKCYNGKIGLAIARL